jgi:hypothetical protein
MNIGIIRTTICKKIEVYRAENGDCKPIAYYPHAASGSPVVAQAAFHPE